MDKTALKRWVESGLKTPPPATDNGKGKEKVQDDEEMQDVKSVGDPANGGADDRAIQDGSTSTSKANSTSPSASTTKDTNSPAPSVSETRDQAPPSPRDRSLSPLAPPPPEQGTVKALSELVKAIDNSQITCPHGHANPQKPQQMKRVSQVRLSFHPLLCPTSFVLIILRDVSLERLHDPQRAGNQHRTRADDDSRLLSRVCRRNESG